MTIDAAHPRIRRHFATCGNRQVHYRRGGKGPVVVLLHQSPTSSRESIPLMERIMDDFSIVAPDTPGNGLSDPLGITQPEAADYAEGLAEMLDELGVERCGLFGTHTGGCTATEFARLYPERVSVLIVDGVTCWTDEERGDILENYLPRFEPAWDGSHLTWLWARLRQQMMFFPWYNTSLAARMDLAMPTPDQMFPGFLDYLRAGDNYRDAYASAFRYRGNESLAKVTVPTYLLANEQDMLFGHFDRLQDLPPNVVIERFGREKSSLHERTHELLRAHLGQSEAPTPQSPRPIGGRPWQDFADVDGGQLHVRRHDGAGGRPVVVQHDAASDNNVVRDVVDGFVGKRPVIAFDLPGNGESDNTISGNAGSKITCETYADVTRQALASMGIQEIDYIGTWGSGFTGIELCKIQKGLVAQLIIVNVIYHSRDLRIELKEKYTPTLERDKHGAFLLFCWNAMRDQSLFWPWYNATSSGVLSNQELISTEMIHRRTVSLLKCWNMWREHYGAHWDYELDQNLSGLSIPIFLAAPEGHNQSDEVHGAFPNTKRLVVGSKMKDWPKSFLAELGD